MDEMRRILPALPVHPTPEMPRDYRLRVDGSVRRPVDLRLDDLLRMTRAGLEADFSCLEGWVAPGQRWTGVPLLSVIAEVEPETDVCWVCVAAGDFVAPLTMDEAAQALLAVELNGEPLPLEHGAPVRLLVPGGECFTSVKWVDHVWCSITPPERSGERIALDRLERGSPRR